MVAHSVSKSQVNVIGGGLGSFVCRMVAHNVAKRQEEFQRWRMSNVTGEARGGFVARVVAHSVSKSQVNVIGGGLGSFVCRMVARRGGPGRSGEAL